MALDDDTLRAQLSVLDRLIDERPDDQRERAMTAAQTMTRLREAVRRDLEILLNTRERCRGWPSVFGEIDSSVVAYGLPDLSALSLDGEWRSMLCKRVTEAIRRFEPRLISVRVQFDTRGDGLERSARLRIEAMMHADPAPEPVTFDTHIDSATRLMSVADR
ncbi:type VI secretion system baseplate subunit TssE [Reyranella sp. CPCC 100927]|uniref:type VI secretion system baseplate subunit TssE n=1 Tax=Reyranella sp. CPCC 100927 TaxID=2599616 RepID=UPI0011B5F204|nr:type VI secretion system baseplate subunit TssE [Reyranella sp. CPCC 100927]TWT08708.1 type VI secretion system baseplate subunit TssE [Reyranella sp. CPCC 100927]